MCLATVYRDTDVVPWLTLRLARSMSRLRPFDPLGGPLWRARQTTPPAPAPRTPTSSKSSAYRLLGASPSSPSGTLSLGDPKGSSWLAPRRLVTSRPHKLPKNWGLDPGVPPASRKARGAVQVALHLGQATGVVHQQQRREHVVLGAGACGTFRRIQPNTQVLKTGFEGLHDEVDV